jgi:hypothetical protein
VYAAGADGREQPPSMLAIAEARRETSTGIECATHSHSIELSLPTRPAAYAIADQRAVLDS